MRLHALLSVCFMRTMAQYVQTMTMRIRAKAAAVEAYLCTQYQYD